MHIYNVPLGHALASLGNHLLCLSCALEAVATVFHMCLSVASMWIAGLGIYCLQGHCATEMSTLKVVDTKN